MLFTDPLLTTQEEPFTVGESDFAFYGNYVSRCGSCALVVCTSGSAEVTVNQYRRKISRNMFFFLLPGWMLMLTERTEDFGMRYCAFSKEMFAEAAFRLEPTFFHILRDCPIEGMTADMARSVEAWFRMMEYTYRDKGNLYRNTILRNRLQNMLLECYDKYQRFSSHRQAPVDRMSRQAELFHRFAQLTREHCLRNRDVAFYADRLCISTRYLATVVRNIAHSSVKEFIDRAVVLEIKMLLQSSDLSVQEIAYRLHFPDQSYLGRYFKNHTGMSPTEYRNARK